MQVFAVVARVLLVTLAVSAAKLPLPPPAPPSTLYDAPFESIPVPSQPAVAFQIPAEVPSVPVQISTLYEAPVEDLPSVAHSSHVVPNSEFPPSFGVPVQQAGVLQSQSNLVPVPAEPSDLYELPVETFPASAQHSNVNVAPVPVQPFETQPTSVVIQTPEVIIPVPAEPSTLYETPFANVPAPSQQPSFVQSPFNAVPVSVEATVLHNVPAGNLPFPSQQANVHQTTGQIFPDPAEPSTVQQSTLVQTPVQSIPIPVGPSIQIVSVPAEPSTLYDIPVENFASPSQATSFSQTPGAVPHGQFVPVNQFHTQSNKPAVIGVTNPSDNSASFNTQGGLFQGDITQSSNAFSQASLAPAEPSGLYETPDAAFSVQAELAVLSQSPTDVLLPSAEPTDFFGTPNFGLPSTDTFSSVQSVQQVNEPTQLYQTPNQPIQFPAEPSIISPVSVELVPVPSVPSTLYGLPEQVGPVSSLGKAMASDNDIQREIEVAPSTIYEVPVAASEPVVSTASKGGMMKPMPYDFQWGVEDSESGSSFSHVENNDGQTTRGEYRVTLPDGRIQVVNFYDNGNGFHADVTYE